MFLRVINFIADSFLQKLPSPAYLVPVQQSNAVTTLQDIFDGFLLATPKNRTPIRRILSKRYGNENWKYGQKLFKSKQNIVSCLECGDFHEIHAICRSCYKKVEEESKKILEKIRAAVGQGVIDTEVQVLYEGETSPEPNQKRIVELDRPRPMWFVSNLSQRAANPRRSLDGPPVEPNNFTVRIKEGGNS